MLRAAGIAEDTALQVDALSSEEEGYEAAKALLGRGVLFDACLLYTSRCV